MAHMQMILAVLQEEAAAVLAQQQLVRLMGRHKTVARVLHHQLQALQSFMLAAVLAELITALV
jgi:hypothetical protein